MCVYVYACVHAASQTDSYRREPVSISLLMIRTTRHDGEREKESGCMQAGGMGEGRGGGRGRDRCEMQLRRLILYVARRNGLLPSIRGVEKHARQALHEDPIVIRNGSPAKYEKPLLSIGLKKNGKEN